jgi:hypothetical protein
MRISINQVSSVMLKSKKLEIQKKCIHCERADKNQKECHEIEPNPSKMLEKLPRNQNVCIESMALEFLKMNCVEVKKKYKSTLDKHFTR